MGRRARNQKRPANGHPVPHAPPQPPPEIAPRRRRQLRWLALIGVVLLAILVLSGRLAAIPRGFAVQALHRHDLDGAQRWLDWAARLGPRDPETAFLQARLLRKLGHNLESGQELERAVRLGLDPQRARRETLLARAGTGDVFNIAMELDRMLIDPGDDGREICEAYVNGLLVTANYDTASALIAVWKQDFPDDAQPYYVFARALEHLGRHEQAEQEYRAALDKQPDPQAALYVLGRFLLTRNRAADAQSCFQRALEFPYNAAARIGLAQCLRTEGRTDEARRMLEAVVKLPRDAVVQGYQRVDEPLEGLPAHYELGSLLSALGEYETALPLLEQAVAANPRDLEARYARGVALRGAGRLDEGSAELEGVAAARKALTEADRLVDGLKPDEPMVAERFRIGELYMQHGSRKRGEMWLKAVLSHDPQHKRAHELLAEFYAELARDDPDYAAAAEEHRRAAAGIDAPDPP
jgi:tetratricopeptide (TPR) repeat protein